MKNMIKYRLIQLLSLTIVFYSCRISSVPPETAHNKLKTLKEFAGYAVVNTDAPLYFKVDQYTRTNSYRTNIINLNEHSGNKLIARLKKGSKLRILKHSVQKYKYWRNNSYFYEVKTEQGQTGWIYGLWINIGIDPEINPCRTLFNGISEGKNDEVKKLVYGGADVNTCNNYGQTLLMLACKLGNFEIVKFLIDYGAKVNAISTVYVQEKRARVIPNDGCTTPLTFAAYYGFLEIAKYLTAKGANLNYTGVFAQKPAFVKALEKKHYGIARFLIEKGANVNIKFYNGWNALMLLTHLGETKLAKFIVDNRADLNAQTGPVRRWYKEETRLIPGTTALMLAAHHGNLELVKHFVKKGAKINTINEAGFNALKVAAIERNKTIVNYLKGCNAEERATSADLIKFVLKNDLNKIRKVLKHGAAINGIVRGYTALMVASEKGFINVAKLLIAKDADVNVVGTTTALIQAITFGHTAIAKLLIQKGADVNAYPRIFCEAGNAMFFAVKKKNRKIVNLLIKHSANVNIGNCNSTTPIFYATDIEIFKMLIKAGADVNHENLSGYTPLMVEVMNGTIERIQLLLKAGAKINHITRNEETAYKFAVSKNKTAIARFLKGIGGK
jgi:ankyrin repeat protein